MNNLFIASGDLMPLMVTEQSTLRTDSNLVRLTEIFNGSTSMCLTYHRHHWVTATDHNIFDMTLLVISQVTSSQVAIIKYKRDTATLVQYSKV